MNEVAGKDATMWDVQTRAVGGELKYFESVKDAMAYAAQNNDVWKISFDTPRDRIRLVRVWLDEEHSVFEYSDLMDEVNEELRKRGRHGL